MSAAMVVVVAGLLILCDISSMLSYRNTSDSSGFTKIDRNGGIWRSGISKSLAEYVQRHVCFVNVQSSLHENVIFTVCALMDNATYIIFIMWNSISG